LLEKSQVPSRLLYDLFKRKWFSINAGIFSFAQQIHKPGIHKTPQRGNSNLGKILPDAVWQIILAGII